MTDEVRRDGLRAEIHRIFDDREYPGDDALVAGLRGYEDEARSLFDVVKGRTWQEALPHLRDLRDMEQICNFTQQGFMYYLPAYLMRMLSEDFWTNHDSMADAITDELLSDDHISDFETWGEPEKGLIGKILRFVYEDELDRMDVSPLAKAYWHQYED